jgi:uncharacterized protein YlzI (FlbEa/FlbD family)
MATSSSEEDSYFSSDEEDLIEQPEAKPTTITIATYSFIGEEDIDHVIDELKEYAFDPTIIALQNIEKYDYVKVLRRLKKEGYIFYLREETKTADYGEILFSRLPILKSEFHPFSKTRQNRGITCYLVKVPLKDGSEGKLVWIATSQFEDDGTGSGCRRSQITELDKLFMDDERVIFAGDTCITQYQNKTHKRPDGWMDAWEEKGTEEDEETTDEGDRRDRIWVKGMEILEFGIAYDDVRTGIFAIVKVD